MRPLVLPLVAAAALAAGPAFAGLHKCTTKEGKTIYTEFECEGDAKKADVTIRDSSGFDGTKAPAKSSAAAGAPKSAGAPPKDAPAAAPKGARAKDPILEAIERDKALSAEKARETAK